MSILQIFIDLNSVNSVIYFATLCQNAVESYDVTTSYVGEITFMHLRALYNRRHALSENDGSISNAKRRVFLGKVPCSRGRLSRVPLRGAFDLKGK